jgi:hypothetical protein
MKLYLDDDTSAPLLARLLRRAGHDVQVPADVGRAGAADPVHLRLAALDGRALVTANYDDYEDLHKLVVELQGHHCGVLVLPKDNVSCQRRISPMTGLIRDPLSARMLIPTIVAAAFILSLPTPALAEDWGHLLPEIWVPLATRITGAYAFAVLIALLFKIFRWRTALYISFVLSAIVSGPGLGALAYDWKYLSRQITQPLPQDKGLLGGVVLVAVLLCFVWVAPIVQYRLVRRNTGRSTQLGG